MRTRLLSALVSLLAAAAFADSADLSVSLTATTPDRPGRTTFFPTWVVNAGPDAAHDVVVTVRVNGFPLAQRALGDVGPRETVPVHADIVLPMADATLAVTAEVTSSTLDPNPQNNTAAENVEISSAPWVQLGFNAPQWIDPGMPFQITPYVWNADGFAVAHDVVISVEIAEGTGVDALPDKCVRASDTRVDCGAGDVESTSTFPSFPLQLRAPRRFGGETLGFRAALHAREKLLFDAPLIAHAALSRSFVVTNTASAGAGSLRAAIDAANAACLKAEDFCAIVFDIAEPSARPWKTIHVDAPLPAVRARSIHIDGATETALAGIANPDGPPIEISGGGTVIGDGLTLSGCTQTLSNLAINGFRSYGIFSDGTAAGVCGGSRIISNNFIGVDPSGAAAVPNHRGIATLGRQQLTIESNVISGNERAGIFALGGFLRIIANRIGVAAHSDDSVPNGASGIYIGTDANERSLIDRNVIAFNGDMGLAIDGNVHFAGGIGNRIWGNGGLALDIGLDGPSPIVSTLFGPLDIPAITSATFDPATGQTTIRGVANSRRFSALTEIFACDAPRAGGRGDAQRFVAATANTDFVVTVKADLRGQWISAWTTLFDSGFNELEPSRRTTELGVAVQVEK